VVGVSIASGQPKADLALVQLFDRFDRVERSLSPDG
jgi:hypothetical protein